jgi:hypothetical protein
MGADAVKALFGIGPIVALASNAWFHLPIAFGKS